MEFFCLIVGAASAVCLLISERNLRAAARLLDKIEDRRPK